MVQVRSKATIVEETVARITRSSPRRRKREPEDGTDGTENPSATPKRVKFQRNDANTTIHQAVKQETGLESNLITATADKLGSRQKRRPTSGTSEASEFKAEGAGLGHIEGHVNGDSTATSTRQGKRKEVTEKARKVKRQISVEGEEKAPVCGSRSKHKRNAKESAKSIKEAREQDTETEDQNKDIDSDTPKKPKRRRKTKEEKEAEAMPLAARTVGLRMFVGAHVSVAKGVQNSITNCHHIGGNALGLFLKSQRKWDNPALADENRDAFHSHCHSHQYDAASHILPHGSYLVNLAQEDEDRAKQSYDAFIDDLRRCESLGIKLYNFHPGAANSSPLAEAIKRLANQLNIALASTETVTPLLETMAGSGTVIGSRFSDLRDIISQIKPEFRSRIGVCLDTCHVFAAGYDLRTLQSFKKVLQDFDEIVGMQYLKALHLNDSKAVFNSKRDLHQNIGLGFLGLRAFHNVMNEPRFENLPLILETPCERPDPEDPTGKKMIDDKRIWAREIKLLESLIGMDVEGEEFRRLEQELSEKGREEREKMLRAVEAKEEKERKKLEKGQRSLLDMMNGAGKRPGKDRKEKKGTRETNGTESSGDQTEPEVD